MRRAFLVTYDIGDPKRLRSVYRLMRGYGDHLQLSVFHCELSDRERVEMEGRLREIIHQREDQVLVVDLGPAGGRAASAIRALGRRHVPPTRVAVIV